MKFRSQFAICMVASVGFFAACGDDDSEPPAGTGGVGGGGGATTGGVGGKATGGASTTGGNVSSGGAGGGPGTGGTSSGGASSGGASSGGASSGGASSGGASTDAGPDGSDGPDGGDPDSGTPTPDVVINEIESNDDAEDWIELYNRGTTTANISGWSLLDSPQDDSTAYVFPANTTIAAGAVFVVQRADFDFGLGGTDSMRLFNGTTLVDSHSWTSHAAGTDATLQRCPNGTGNFVTATQTKNAVNTCPQ